MPWPGQVRLLQMAKGIDGGLAINAALIRLYEPCAALLRAKGVKPPWIKGVAYPGCPRAFAPLRLNGHLAIDAQD